MSSKTASIPRPLVRAIQTLIVVSVVLSWVLSRWTEGFFWILLLPLLSGLSGLLFSYNLVFAIARCFLKKAPASYVQEDPADQRFNQILATSMLGLSFVDFLLGYQVIGFAFSAFVFAAALIALMGFCVGCYLRYQLVKRRAAR